MEFDIVYVFINLFLLTVFICAGKNLSAGSKKIPGLISCVVLFSVVMGLRYGRGVDYFHYILVYKYDLESTQKGFTAFNNVLKYFSISPYAIFFFYALFFIYAGVQLVKPFKELAKYLLPLFLWAFIFFVEFAIRQAFSFSFIFLYILQLNQFFIAKEKKALVWAFLSATIAYSIHSGNAIEILFVTVLFVLSTVKISWKPLVCLFLLSKYVLHRFVDFSWLNKLIVYFYGANEKFEGYINHADQWFSAEAAKSIYTRNFAVDILETIAICFLIYLTTVTISRMKGLYDCFMNRSGRLMLTIFYCFVFGSCFLQIFHDMELFRRIFDPLYAFWCFPLAFVLTYKSTYLTKKEREMLVLIMLFFVYEFFKYLFMRGGMTLFLWDM